MQNPFTVKRGCHGVRIGKPIELRSARLTPSLTHLDG